LLGFCILSNISLGLQAGMNFWYIIGTLLTVILPLIFIIVDYNKSGGRRENKDEEIKEKKKLKQEVKYKQAFSNKTTGLIIVGTMVVTFAIIIGILAICGTFF
jgi:heme/copper-type cytochrome/quinol oxidase subunit 2